MLILWDFKSVHSAEQWTGSIYVVDEFENENPLEYLHEIER
jgi:hypothetical protein